MRNVDDGSGAGGEEEEGEDSDELNLLTAWSTNNFTYIIVLNL